MNDYVERTQQLLEAATRLQFPCLAAAIAYHAFVSVLPFCSSLLQSCRLSRGPAVAAATLGRIGAVLTPGATTVVEQALVAGERHCSSDVSETGNYNRHRYEGGHKRLWMLTGRQRTRRNRHDEPTR